MTKMLATVKTLEEANIILQSGADVIDVLVSDLEALRPYAKAAEGKAALSATLPQTVLPSHARELADLGLGFIKIPFESSTSSYSLPALHGTTKWMAVVHVDLASDLPEASSLGSQGFAVIMLDTSNGSRLLNHLSLARIDAYVRECHALSILVGIAGALETPDIPRLLSFQLDILGFKEAFFNGAVADAIDVQAATRIRALIPEERQANLAPGVDYQLLAARGYFPDPAEEGLGTDKIFVRDFVLPVHIGAYSFEHGVAQKMRFDVTAEVLRVTRNPEDMRHIVSYDLIMDGIRTIVARGHIELSETLAERVAAFILENPRVVRVVVRAEKLELGPGGVGVEIERKREAQIAPVNPAYPDVSVSQRRRDH
ncbi:(5-formylfuran-3-yl)methyl phosphate synthase [Phyllobacterium myrsinacearum]|uniref:(5-formylfuran-3-yl)methyl phosphate synthase n=1 Tax=Phyllobacterium myrsinacearum TaxID=28101 RepID=A0A839ESE6_9HYPH|nr:(5-formylfuran-3-yl)methyl phosphate synthase [Phyllobacterium myrsinacearum]MBA8879357.1 dihydroneopterin aldolase [Phyllobacterium myrsinacearum]